MHPSSATQPEPTTSQALIRGALCKCPQCGEGALFRKYLKVVDTCGVCGEELKHHRADDMPAYIVMSIVGHIVVGGLFWAEFTFGWPMWLHLSIWLPLTVILTLALLPPVKGFIVALQWNLRMHGFGESRPPRAVAAVTT
jgi:uncharacterized protein (DUF983 family)